MKHVIQVGVGSGGMPVLDMIARDARIGRVTIIEPDIYKPHNVTRHLFAAADIGESKAVLAERWLRDRRPDLDVHLLEVDLMDPKFQDAIHQAAGNADLGVCAVDNEQAKFHWDALMRQHRIPWTLGEVLSGGIGGFVHRFVPDGPCYGCVSSHLKRSVRVDENKQPDYSQPAGPVETTIPAGKASIQVIASLHALWTLDFLDGKKPDFTTLLLTLQEVPKVFDEALRPYRFRIARLADCLVCRERTELSSAKELDVELDQALARLGDG